VGVTHRRLRTIADGVRAFAEVSRPLRAALTPLALRPSLIEDLVSEVACGALTAAYRSLTSVFTSQATAGRGPFTPTDCYRTRTLSSARALEPTLLGASHHNLV